MGEYLGTKEKDGQFGDYKVHMIKVRGTDIRYVSGAMLNDLFALIEPGSRVRVVYKGKMKAKGSGNEYKAYEVFTEEAVEFKIAESA